MSAPGARAAFGLLLVLAGAAAARGAEPTDAEGWLNRMEEALAARTYDGEFLHLAQGRVERLRILHRAPAQGGGERLVSLSGSGREVVRNDTSRTYYLPDQRRVLVEALGPGGPLLGTLPHLDLPALDASYRIGLGGRSVGLLGAPAQEIDVTPRDRRRFGYRLWVDVATAMPIRTDLCDVDGRVLEQVLFIRLDFPHRLPGSLLRSAIDTHGFTTVSQSEAVPHGSAAVLWSDAQLPPGFAVRAVGTDLLPGGDPATHLVLSDGLATVSVFVEPAGAARAVHDGQAEVGSAYALSLVVGSERVTAIGEAPPDTVRLIASAIGTAAGGLH